MESRALNNNKMNIVFPDGFTEMTRQELAQMKQTAMGSAVYYTNPERHMIVTVGWKSAGIFQKSLDAAALCSKMEPALQKANAPFGYQLKGHAERKIGGQDAKAVQFTYTAQDIDMYSESYAAKNGKDIYYFNLYTRVESWENNKVQWENLLNSVSFAG